MVFSSSILVAALVFWQVDPYNSVPYLPDAEPAGGRLVRALDIASARGEVTGVSFSVRPDADLRGVDFRFSDARTEKGATLSASSFDLYHVKCVYRPKGQWLDPAVGNRKSPTLMNQILLHDDALLKTDEKRQVNLLRLDGPEGSYYADMGPDGDKGPFNASIEPVSDAAAFVPSDLPAVRCHQFFVICRTPKAAEAGDYRGVLAVLSEGREVAKLDIGWRVRPFALPRARTHYDTSREYMLGFYHHCKPADLLAECGDLAQAEAKGAAVARSWVEHNILFPIGPGSLSGDDDEINRRGLAIWRREGLPCRPVIAGNAGDFAWACPPGGKNKSDPKTETERHVASLAAFREHVARETAVQDSLLGHHERIFLAPDECGSATNRRLFDYWRILHAAGCSAYTDAGKIADIGWMCDADNEPALIDHRRAWAWHASGARCFSYAAPFTGPVCPDIWRRTKGLRLWMSDYDGLVEYNFAEGPNRWNEFINRNNSPYNQFGLVFLTKDGLISTLAYEALREGLNDVRYYSLMRLQAELAMAAEKPEVRELGHRAIAWQDAVDPEEILNLDVFRQAVSDWIVRLRAATGRDAADFAEGPVPAVPADTGRISSARRDLRIRQAAAVRADVSKPSAVRTSSAVTEADLLSGMYRRTEAVAALDDLLADEKRIKGEDAARLLLAKARVLVRPTAFAERASKARIEAAADALSSVLTRPANAKELQDTIFAFGTAYLQAGEYDGAIAFASAQLKAQGLSNVDRAILRSVTGRALRAKGDVEGAVRELRSAAKLRRGPGEVSLYCLEPLAELAEETKDWSLALYAYLELKGCYHPEYDTERAMVAYYKGKIAETMPKVSKSISPAKADSGGDGQGITLDE